MDALVDRFARICEADPKRPLIHLPASDRTLTASELRDRCGAQQALLSALLRRGDVVLCAAGNRPGFIALLLACWDIGASVLLVDASTPARELLDLGERFDASSLVMRTSVAEGMSSTPLDEDLHVVSRQPHGPPAVHGAAVLKLTSGSTGVPKAVIVPPAQLIAEGVRIVSAMGIAPEDVQLVAIPLSHSYGFGNLVLPLLFQGTAMVLRDGFVPHQIDADARKYGARVLHGTPFMYQHLLAHPPESGWPPTLTFLVSAGAVLDLETARRFHAQFGLKIHSFYGASEAGAISFDDGDGIGDIPTVGRAMRGVRIELRADAGIPAGYRRVHVSSDAVSPGYLGEVSERDDLRDGGFLTGDYGQLLDDGRLVLAGRVSSFINVAGRKVQPEEVERVLRTMEGVQDVRVLSTSDAVRGEQIAAVVVGPQGLTLADLRRHCARRLAPYKIPRVAVFIDRLPLTSRGKVDFRVLCDLVRSRSEQDH